MAPAGRAVSSGNSFNFFFFLSVSVDDHIKLQAVIIHLRIGVQDRPFPIWRVRILR